MTRHSEADLNAQLLSIHELYSYFFYLLAKAGIETPEIVFGFWSNCG